MTFKDTKGHQNCCYLIGRVSVLFMARGSKAIVDSGFAFGVQLTMATCLCLFGSLHTYSGRAFCFGRRVCLSSVCLSVQLQVSNTKRHRREISSPL